MTEYVLAFDPGVSSGVALASFGEDKPFDLVNVWQFGNGIQGLLDWLDEHIPSGRFLVEKGQWALSASLPTIISEKFTPRSALTLKGSIPLVGEGVLIGRGLLPPYTPKSPQWQDPSRQYRTFGGTDLANKKKTARAKMKELGWYKMPKELGTPDSDDALSASLHALSYVLHTKKHRPTFDLIAGNR